MVEHTGEGKAGGMPGDALNALALGAVYVFGGLVVLFLAVVLAALVWTGSLVSLAWWLFMLPARTAARLFARAPDGAAR